MNWVWELYFLSEQHYPQDLTRKKVISIGISGS